MASKCTYDVWRITRYGDGRVGIGNPTMKGAREVALRKLERGVLMTYVVQHCSGVRAGRGNQPSSNRNIHTVLRCKWVGGKRVCTTLRNVGRKPRRRKKR